MLGLVALSLVPRLLLGFLVIELTCRPRTQRRVLAFFMAWPVGVGVSSLLSFLWIWMGLELHFYAIIETAAILLVFAPWVWKHRRATWEASQTLPLRWAPRQFGWGACLGAAALMFSVQFWAISLQNPHGSWDAWVHYNVVSRFVYRGGEGWQGTFLRIRDNPDYPLLLAMTNATTWELVQSDTTRGPMVLAFLSTCCLVGVLFGLVREVRGSAQASLVAIMLLTQPLLVQNGISQYADVPEACYFLASAGMLLLYLRSRETSLSVLAGLTAGLGAWAKNEGLLFAATSLVVWSYLSWRERSLAIKHYLLGAAAPLVVFGLFKVFLAPHGEFDNFHAMLVSLVDPVRYLAVLREAGIAFWQQTAGSGGLVLILAVYGFLIGSTKQRIAGLPHLTVLIAAQASAYLLIWVGTPHSYGQLSQIPTSIGRLYMHVLPLMLGALFLWLKSPPDLNLLESARGSASLDSVGQQIN